MYDHIQGLGWFVRRARDPERLAAFYQEALGLPVLRRSANSVSLWMGETAVLEIAEGGHAAPAYTNRNQATCYPVFRVYNFGRILERVRAPESSPAICGPISPTCWIRR